MTRVLFNIHLEIDIDKFATSTFTTITSLLRLLRVRIIFYWTIGRVPIWGIKIILLLVVVLAGQVNFVFWEMQYYSVDGLEKNCGKLYRILN